MEYQNITEKMYDAPGESDDMDYKTAVNDSDCEHHTHYDPNDK